jgi:hypothetical protein
VWCGLWALTALSLRIKSVCFGTLTLDVFDAMSIYLVVEVSLPTFNKLWDCDVLCDADLFVRVEFHVPWTLLAPAEISIVDTVCTFLAFNSVKVGLFECTLIMTTNQT